MGVQINETALVACWVFYNLWNEHFSHFKGNRTLCSYAQWFVNGYQLLGDAHTVLEPHRGNAAFFHFTRYRPFYTFF